MTTGPSPLCCQFRRAVPAKVWPLAPCRPSNLRAAAEIAATGSLPSSRESGSALLSTSPFATSTMRVANWFRSRGRRNRFSVMRGDIAVTAQACEYELRSRHERASHQRSQKTTPTSLRHHRLFRRRAYPCRNFTSRMVSINFYPASARTHHFLYLARSAYRDA
jgi:hypothetical protein